MGREFRRFTGIRAQLIQAISLSGSDHPLRLQIKLKMRKAYYILLLSILIASCQGKDFVRPNPIQGEAISLSAGIIQDYNSKGIINDLTGLAGDGFVVWGAWTQDPSDEAHYSGDYAFGTTDRVFGLNGTKVYYPDWTYSPERFWTRGTYNFAAAAPASAFDSEYAMKNDKMSAAGIKGQIGQNGQLTLGQWDLKDNQIDLLVGFDNIDNRTDSRDKTDPVTLKLEHQLAQVAFKANIDGSNQSGVEIKGITMYGNTRTSTQATFTCDDKGTVTKDDDVISAEWILGAKATSETDFFAQRSGSWTSSGSTIMEGVLVFPETFSFTVVVDYVESYAGASATISQSGTVTGTWEAAKKYLYEFTLSSKNIVFSEPIVTPWTEGGKADQIPPM